MAIIIMKFIKYTVFSSPFFFSHPLLGGPPRETLPKTLFWGTGSYAPQAGLEISFYTTGHSLLWY